MDKMDGNSKNKTMSDQGLNIEHCPCKSDTRFNNAFLRVFVESFLKHFFAEMFVTKVSHTIHGTGIFTYMYGRSRG